MSSLLFLLLFVLGHRKRQLFSFGTAAVLFVKPGSCFRQGGPTSQTDYSPVPHNSIRSAFTTKKEALFHRTRHSLCSGSPASA